MKRKIIEKTTSLILILAVLTVLFSGCGPGGGSAGGTVSVTDCAGRTVEVPADPQSICCVCPFSGSVLVMLGRGDRLTSTCNNVARSNLLKTICPSVGDAAVVKNSGSVNGEAVIELGTDLIIVNDGMYESGDERAKLDSLGIPYIVIGFRDLEGQLDAVEVLGKALGNEKKAGEYTEWCRSVYSYAGMIASEHRGERAKLYHSVNEATRTDYEGSICAEWIGMTGAVNVSLGSELRMQGDKAYTTLEQIYSWDPDLIICNETNMDRYMMTDGKWAGLRAVREGRVYQIPIGVSRMGHPTSTETPLALLWLTELLYPEESDTDMKREIKEYYLRFYGFEVSDELAEDILAGKDMRTEKTNKSAE